MFGIQVDENLGGNGAIWDKGCEMGNKTLRLGHRPIIQFFYGGF